MEFLAARQIHNLIEAGLLAQSAACRMLFGLTGSNETILRPSMRPVAAWPALLRTDMFDRVVEIEPDALLTQGDPGVADGSPAGTRAARLRGAIRQGSVARP